jgi:hypothetical protein
LRQRLWRCEGPDLQEREIRDTRACVRVSASWERDGECRSSPQAFCRGPDSDGAAVFFDKLLTNPQPETGADRALGRKEGVEDLLYRGLSDAVPAIGYGDADAPLAAVRIDGG